MKTTEFLSKVEKTEGGCFVIYRSSNYRWEENETADPIIEDEKFHFTEAEALIRLESLSTSIGFTPVIDMITTDFSTEDFEDEESIDFEDLISKWDEVETVHSGYMNSGASLNEDGVIVTYRHHRYMGYAYNIEGVEFVKHTDLNYESDLVNEKDSTTAYYFAYFEDLEALESAYNDSNFPFNKINKGSILVTDFIESNN